MSHSQADGALADAIWWFRGFSASQPADMHDKTYDLAGALLTARNWLNRLARGKTRLIGLDERSYSVVLTEYEFEVLGDGLRDNADADDRDKARKIVSEVFAALRAEQKEARECGVPF